MTIELRTISTEDVKAIRLLSKQLGYEISLKDTKANINAILCSKDHIAFLALIDAEIVGWAHAFKTTTIESKPFIELAGLVVDEKYRSRGIGKMLLEKIKQWCIEQNLPALRVRSNVKRKEAHRFYLNNGFKEIKEQKVFQTGL